MAGAEEAEIENDDVPTVKRRILFVSHEMTLSGAPILLAHLVGWLKTHGWEVVVVANEEGPAAEIFRSYGVELLFHSDLLSDPAHTALRSMILRYDLVVANTIAAFRAVQAAQLEHTPVLWYLHETLVAQQMIEQIPELRTALANIDAIVTPTAATAEIYRPHTSRPIHVVPHGYPEVRAAAPAPGHAFTFVMIATYERRKGQDIFLEAIRELHPDMRWRASFQMAGRTLEKPFREALLASSESMPNVQLLGPLSQQSALDLLNNSDVLVCASRDESMPLVLLEAMSLGKAIISTEVGGVREWLRDGENALLVPTEDSRALAISLARCIGDRDLVRAVSAGAKKTFQQHFQLDVYGRRFAGIMEKTIAQARTKGTPGNYAQWIELYETLGPVDRTALRRKLDSLGRQPLISVLLPVYNPDLNLLGLAIDSVKRQIYEHWELCIADDASSDAAVKPFLQAIASGESRIKLTLRERNGHIAACSNSAIALARGEWCALLDQDDMLAEHALAKVALEIAARPEAGLIYSDEDKIDMTGNRSNPFFKMDWNPQLFLAQNYIGHLGVYRHDLLGEIGGFREGFEGSQDYDLALRCVERLQPAQIRHIPRVLYHWRMVSGSLAEKRDAKPYAKEAARRAIADHLRHTGIAGRAEPCPENIESHRVIYELPNPTPRVMIVIDAASAGSRVNQCLDSVRSLTSYNNYEVVVATNRPQLNRQARETEAALVLFVNSDVEVIDRDWLNEMVSQAFRGKAGVVGARLWYPDGTLRDSGLILGIGGIATAPFQQAPRGHAGFFNRTFLQRNCSAVSASCMAVRHELFCELEGFDEVNLTSSYQDLDLCLRVQERGYEVIWTPYANLVQHDSPKTEGNDNATAECIQHDTAYMRERWGDRLQNDPYYSPNLSLEPPGFALAFPPRWFSNDS